MAADGFLKSLGYGFMVIILPRIFHLIFSRLFSTSVTLYPAITLLGLDPQTQYGKVGSQSNKWQLPSLIQQHVIYIDAEPGAEWIAVGVKKVNVMLPFPCFVVP